MIEYRPFHNTDPPKLAALWNASSIGRGAPAGISSDALETLVFSQPYFDRNGLIVAADGENVLGCVHAGFGCNEAQTALDFRNGVICAVLVHLDHRRRGIGRELVRRAEAYLRAAGAADVHAGPAPPRDPFYVGLYGGSGAAGFLDSDPTLAPFFAALGYEPHARHLVFHCDLGRQAAGMSLRLMSIRRRMELRIVAQPQPLTWWWTTRFGRLDSLQFYLVPKGGGDSVAEVTVLGLDHYVSKWQARSIGMADLVVNPALRRQGYGEALVLAVTRRLKEELVTAAECLVPADNAGCVALLEACSFQQVDAGTVYVKTDYAPDPAALARAERALPADEEVAPEIEDTIEMADQTASTIVNDDTLADG